MAKTTDAHRAMWRNDPRFELVNDRIMEAARDFKDPNAWKGSVYYAAELLWALDDLATPTTDHTPDSGGEPSDRPEREVEAIGECVGLVRGELRDPVRADRAADALRTLTAERDRLEAENERLRGVLDDMLCFEVPVGVGAKVADWFKDMARRALGREDADGHLWFPTGKYLFRRNSTLSSKPTMHVTCRCCGARTWFNREQWEAMKPIDAARHPTSTPSDD